MTKTNSAHAPSSSRRCLPVIGIIAAAGKGVRLGAESPKAFVTLQGQTLLERSLDGLLRSQVVDEVIVVVSPDMIDYTQTLLQKSSVRVVAGGGERADSVWAGLQAIADEEAIVLIHDAARALTPPSTIARVVDALNNGAQAAIPVVPVADTIKTIAAADSNTDTVETTVDRSRLRAAQTPQGFILSRLRAANRAYFEAIAEGHNTFVATDDASLMEWYGTTVTCVPGDDMAFKITTPLDMALAQTLCETDSKPDPAPH